MLRPEECERDRDLVGRKIELGLGRLVAGHLPHVADDTDDRYPWRIEALGSEPKTPAYGVFTCEQLARHRFVDLGREWRIGIVTRIERSATFERHAQRLEISRCHDPVADDPLLQILGSRRRLALDPDQYTPTLEHEGRVVRIARGSHAGQRPHALEHAAIEPAARRTIGILRGR